MSYSKGFTPAVAVAIWLLLGLEVPNSMTALNNRLVTLMKIVYTVSAFLQTKDNPVTFIGISTPLTWAATPAPPPLQHQLPPGSADSSVSSISSNSSEDSDASHHAEEAAAAAGAGPAFLTDKDAVTR